MTHPDPLLLAKISGELVAKPRGRRGRRGFALIELLVVVSIVGLLIALLLPAVQGAREAARRVKCADNLRQMGLALAAYHDALGSLPMGYVAWANPNPYVTSPGWGWAAMLLPQLEQGAVYASANVARPVEDPANFSTRRIGLNVFICPSDRDPGLYMATRSDWVPIGEFYTNSYAASFGAGLEIDDFPERGNGLFRRNLVTRIADIRDGTSSTIALGERGACLTKTPWVGIPNGAISSLAPDSPIASYASFGRGAELVVAHADTVIINNPGTAPDDFYSPHIGGGQFLMADGSVRFLKSTINLSVYRALCTRDQGEIISAEDY
jgi:prepilin-type N-terminal cleavage/methylation domain-containing protein/prepilin-type processing-associated H-X9-DG protein